MINVTKIDISTKPASGLDAVRTHLTINWEGMNEDEIRQLAQQALIVKLQAGLRRNYEKVGIPTDLTVEAREFKVGSRTAAVVNPEKVKDMFSKMTPEQRAALIAELSA